MKRIGIAVIAMGALLVWGAAGEAQERGTWRAASKTAQSITGDVAFGGEKMAIGLSSFTVAQIRELNAAEVSALFGGGESLSGGGNLYRTSIAADKRFLRKNTLCGGEETQWVVTYVAGKRLQVAFFSGAQMPVFTPEAIGSTTNLCGTFLYVR